MSLSDLALIASSIATGLFSGLMMTLLIVLERMWRQMDAPAYVANMQTFLPAAKGHPVVTVLTLLPFLAPILALLDFGSAAASPRFVLTLLGTLLALGPLLVTLRFNFPLYEAIMGWGADGPPDDWQRVRQRFFLLNAVRFLLALGAMICFLLVLVL